MDPATTELAQITQQESLGKAINETRNQARQEAQSAKTNPVLAANLVAQIQHFQHLKAHTHYTYLQTIQLETRKQNPKTSS